MNRMLAAHQRRRGGWVILDTVCGLLVLVTLTATVAASLIRQHNGERKLADTRAAMRLAEETATALQLGEAPPTLDENAAIEIAPLRPADGMPVKSWVRVRVTQNGRSASLIALVRADAIAPTKGGPGK
jgi:hypothetical protein